VSPTSQLRFGNGCKKMKVDDGVGVSPHLVHSNGITAATSHNSQNVAQIAAAASQLNPFYIDKIFNFQNMFLFSGNGTVSDGGGGGGSASGGPMLNVTAASNHAVVGVKNFPEAHSSQMQSNFQGNVNFNHHHNSNINPTANSLLATTLMQQNLLYNYYNSPAAPSPYLGQAFEHQHHSQQQQLKTKHFNSNNKKVDFSIERILSLPSSPPAEVTKSNLKNDLVNSQQQQVHLLKNSNTSVRFNPSTLTRLGTPMAITAPLPPSMISMISSKQNHHQHHNKNNHVHARNQTRSNNNNNHHSMTVGSSQMTTSHQQQQQQQQQAPVVKSKNAKKYKCDLCGRGFSRSNTLITHRVKLTFWIFFFFYI
jgi:hypothetical protein